ncbi:hypothetical protein JDV02_007655 [Purpureocillium takamizusanense]|uniref:Uncharacterized protein n=1 Tax=Purpureocillium takamizusanense TaxID=2060973 RepID=A0A9Q8QM55_9HYPO|nr:uncharacterized protein JDV02_007655 [Purpureocillium takamizusanense]UNI21686.1 hypothetical protein JDV02_007655 [Purpureocillium takamizusanense]
MGVEGQDGELWAALEPPPGGAFLRQLHPHPSHFPLIPCATAAPFRFEEKVRLSGSGHVATLTRSPPCDVDAAAAIARCRIHATGSMAADTGASHQTRRT